MFVDCSSERRRQEAREARVRETTSVLRTLDLFAIVASLCQVITVKYSWYQEAQWSKHQSSGNL